MERWNYLMDQAIQGRYHPRLALLVAAGMVCDALAGALQHLQWGLCRAAELLRDEALKEVEGVR